jgi:hypothetical protein
LIVGLSSGSHHPAFHRSRPSQRRRQGLQASGPIPDHAPQVSKVKVQPGGELKTGKGNYDFVVGKRSSRNSESQVARLKPV